MATLCEGGGTPTMVATLEKLLVLTIIPQNIPKVNKIKVSKVEFWHVAIAKLHKFPTHPTINRADIVPCVVVMCNKEGIFSIEKGVGTIILTPLEDLFYLSVQPLMLSKVAI
jgi:hypothetical protein